MGIKEKLAIVQRAIIVPKNQFNTFSNFNYRSCEDILESLKPLLGDMLLLIKDDIHVACDRVYVKATVTLHDGDETMSVTAYAREPLSKKGMDESQITGSTSSYARKYALNGMFLIDDNKDADGDDNTKIVVLTENDNNWIVAIKTGRSKLEDLKDENYRKFIEEELKK